MITKTPFTCVCGGKLNWITDDSGCGDLRCVTCTRTSGYASSLREAKRDFERHYNHSTKETTNE
jgi:hypothetical protein